MEASDARDEYVHIPKRLILRLLRDEDGLSSLRSLPSNIRPVIENCASTIREIAVSAGLTAGEESENRPATASSSPVVEGIVLLVMLSYCRFRDQFSSEFEVVSSSTLN